MIHCEWFKDAHQRYQQDIILSRYQALKQNFTSSKCFNFKRLNQPGSKHQWLNFFSSAYRALKNSLLSTYISVFNLDKLYLTLLYGKNLNIVINNQQLILEMFTVRSGKRSKKFFSLQITGVTTDSSYLSFTFGLIFLYTLWVNIALDPNIALSVDDITAAAMAPKPGEKISNTSCPVSITITNSTSLLQAALILHNQSVSPREVESKPKKNLMLQLAYNLCIDIITNGNE